MLENMVTSWYLEFLTAAWYLVWLETTFDYYCQLFFVQTFFCTRSEKVLRLVVWPCAAELFHDRSEVQCLHRWQKVLNPELVKGPWTQEVCIEGSFCTYLVTVSVDLLLKVSFYSFFLLSAGRWQNHWLGKKIWAKKMDCYSKLLARPHWETM